MENNKLLIGAQFTYKDTTGKRCDTIIELFVLRDITLHQLLEGIKYGLKRLSAESEDNREIYENCKKVFSESATQTAEDYYGRQYLSHVSFSSYNDTIAKTQIKTGDRPSFYVDNLLTPICDLGFITSSRIIFDSTGEYAPNIEGVLDTSYIIDAFNPSRIDRNSKHDAIVFPEYNISTRQLYQFDRTPVDIIPPGDPPKKNENGLFSLLLPSLLSIGILLLVRTALMGAGTGGGVTMIVLSAAMGVTALITTTINWKKQKKEYAKNLKNWRTRYQDYIDSLMLKIKTRQEQDTAKLNELYPDVLHLMKKDQNGIYALDEDIYSRSANERDFLSFRIGTSNDVKSTFEVRGDAKDSVFSESDFVIATDEFGNDHVRITLREESDDSDSEKTPLSLLPDVISKRYSNLRNAPLIYSLQDKSALGVVDSELDIKKEYSMSQFFISRMIFELCFYHSPDDLQFVMFFPENHNWASVEGIINRYKFMPHFRGLFPDKSQFVFDKESAGHVMSSLLTIMNGRRIALEEKQNATLPRIICVVFSEHGLKEHALAEYLPKAPSENGSAYNGLGLTFVFVKKYKEHLPAYCDAIVHFESTAPYLAPYNNMMENQSFRFESDASKEDDLSQDRIQKYTQDNTRAFRFFSSIYYARIAQNGKVPSQVSTFELFGCNDDTLEQTISDYWGFRGKREQPSITESLGVPIGKTETGVSFLDLHEKADGPHMLVAGTTGSGKTETIITYLVGLCMKYRPDELNLLLVDMKGGGFTKRLGHLPHVVGAVTDVDGDENGTGAEYMLGRFLNAMKSEIKRRKILFNKLLVDSIDTYIGACADIESFIAKKRLDSEQAEELRKTAKNNPLTHLILVVDEFTELKRFSSENSDIDFIGEITTIARVGRSLGFHIILISQNIEGAITDDIRVNSRAKLCLKVATKQASKEMIGTELAASPQMPGNGRAYLLVGAGSKFEYFQSGFSGAGIEEDTSVEITLASKTGLYRRFYRSDKDNTALLKKKAAQKKSGLDKTQLEAITSAICSVYMSNSNSLPASHMIFRSPLPQCIALDENGKIIDMSRKRGE